MRRPRNGIFDLLAPVYDRLTGSYGLTRLFEALEPLAGLTLLDLGGGTGRLAARGAARLERWAGMGSLILPGPALANLLRDAGLDAKVRRAPFHLLVVAAKRVPGTAPPSG